MPKHKLSDPNFEQRVRDSFDRQSAMKTIGAEMTTVAPGEVHIEFPFNAALTQQNDFMHAGIVTAAVDSACGYAAYTLMPADADVLTVEYKVNFMSPARGERFIAIGRVIKPGRTITVCNGEVHAIEAGREKLIALMQATMMMVSRA